VLQLAPSVPETPGPIVEVSLACNTAATTSTRMDNLETRIIVQTLGGASKQDTGTIQWHSIQSAGSIAVPVLEMGSTIGEEARISCFVNGSSTIMEFYQAIAPIRDVSRTSPTVINTATAIAGNRNTSFVHTRTPARSDVVHELPANIPTAADSSDSDYDNEQYLESSRRCHSRAPSYTWW